MISGIYKITNPEGKIYIGKSKNIEQRFNNYKNLKCKNQYVLLESLKKYGWFYHTFEILEECNIIDLNKKETEYINIFNSVNEGLNIRGQGVYSKKEWIYPESAKKTKSQKMKNHWEQKIIKGTTKQIIHNPTGIIYNSIKEAMEKHNIGNNWNKFYKMLGDQKEFNYLNV